jgi:hypothetical protein
MVTASTWHLLAIGTRNWGMRFQWDHPYYVNADKFKQRFFSTPFSESIAATVRSFKKI